MLQMSDAETKVGHYIHTGPYIFTIRMYGNSFSLECYKATLPAKHTCVMISINVIIFLFVCMAVTAVDRCRPLPFESFSLIQCIRLRDKIIATPKSEQWYTTCLHAEQQWIYVTYCLLTLNACKFKHSYHLVVCLVLLLTSSINNLHRMIMLYKSGNGLTIGCLHCLRMLAVWVIWILPISYSSWQLA